MYFKGINPLKTFVKDSKLFKSIFVSSFIRTLYAKITNKKLRLKYYGGRTVISQDQANIILKNAIIESKPFFMGRHGMNEMVIAMQGLLSIKGLKKINIGEMKKHENCGFFCDKEEDVHGFVNEIIFASSQLDLHGCIRGIFEDYIIREYMPKDAILTHTNMLDFWRYDIPFTNALKGKKVLIIHPLESTIREQYLKRELLFANQNILPAFELKTLRAVQTIMGNRDPRFNNWFEALDFMFKEAIKIDFEVAILGCGAYGMPLAARLKQAGKVAIYMGGVTQMLFGIKGIRWDKDPEANKLYNEYWVRPNEYDKPQNFEKVEDGCYW